MTRQFAAALVAELAPAGGRLADLAELLWPGAGREHGHPGATTTTLGQQPAPAPQAQEGAGPAAQAEDGASQEVGTTDRRQLIQVTGAVTAAEAVRALAEQVARADPTDLEVADIGAAVAAAARANLVVPRAELRARLEPEHLGVEALLGRRLSRPVRDKLTTYAGQYCCLLSWLAYGTGDDPAARAYLSLAARHAADSGDRLLVSSVAEVGTSLVPPAAATDAAAEARRDPRAHPYVTPMFAAKEALGAALLGQPERARAALADMESSVWAESALPGAPFLFDEEMALWFTATVLNALGEGGAAERNLRSSLGLLEGSGKAVLLASTYGGLAESYLRRREPEPEPAAAFAARDLQTSPSRVSAERAGRVCRRLAAHWPELAAVRELGDLVAAVPAYGA